MSRLVGPRVTEMDPEQRAFYETIVTGPRGRSGASLVDSEERMIGPFGPMLLNPEVGMALQSIGLSIQTSCVLRPELRELVILTVAAARGCNFEWNAHLARAQSMGVSSRYLVAAHDGQSTADMDSFSKSVIGLTSMLLSHEAVDVHKYNEISDVAGPKAIFDVITIVSYYDLLASLFRAFELPQPLPVAADSGSDGSEPGAHHCLDGR